SDARLVDLAVEDLAHALFDAAARLHAAGFGALRHPARELLERADTRAHVDGEVLAFTQTRTIELAERCRDRANQDLALAVGHRGHVARPIQIGDSLEQCEIDVAGELERALEAAPLLDVRA